MAYVSDLINSSADHLQAGFDARAGTSVRLVQTLGLTLAGYLAGTIGTYSTLVVPLISSSSSSSKAQLWHRAFEQGKTVVPAAEVVIASLFGWLAVKSNHALLPKLSLPFGQSMSITAAYSTAAVLSVGLIPFTYLSLNTTNERLTDLATRTKSSSARDTQLSRIEDNDVDSLLDVWQIRNAARAAIATTGALLGVWASINWPHWKKV